MNKIISINIGGFVFQIEEDAYAKLEGYINAIRKRFGNTEGSDEIIEDIEPRIAEMLNEKICGWSSVLVSIVNAKGR